MPPHFVQGAGIGTGSVAVATVLHVEQSQLRLRMRSSGCTISSGGPRRSKTSRSVFMAQDVVETSGRRHQPSRLPGAAKRATIAGMSGHHVPKDDAWKLAHLAMLIKPGKRAWLHCDDCRHSIMIEPRELGRQHQLDMQTPLLAISKAMRCTRCGARRGCCWPEPHSTRSSYSGRANSPCMRPSRSAVGAVGKLSS